MTEPELLGRCPAEGHPILRHPADHPDKPNEVEFTCLCSGRADGFYAKPAGVVVRLHPADKTKLILADAPLFLNKTIEVTK